MTRQISSSSHMRTPLSINRKLTGKIIAYALLIAGSVVFLIPLAWLVSTALGTAEDAVRVPHNFFPWPLHFENFPDALTRFPFHIYLGNTLIVTFFGVIGTLFSTSLVAYGFARFRFRGRNALFMILLSTMMIPAQVLLVPTFVLFKNIGWYDTLLPLIVPQWFAVQGFGVFLMRQFIMSIPVAFEDAARLDGANHFQIYWHVILPLSKPILTTLGVLSFLANWNDYIGPLIYISSPGKQTFALALAALPSQYFTNYHQAMAATLAFMLPCLIVFFISQRYLLQGLALTGMGGK